MNFVSPIRQTFPVSVASKKLSPESLEALKALYASSLMDQSSDGADRHGDPATVARWVRLVMKQKKGVASKCIDRFLRHWKAEYLQVHAYEGIKYITGLLQFDADDKTSGLTHDEEVAILKLEQALNGQQRGVSMWDRKYADGLDGARLLYERIGEYAVENHERIDDICYVIRMRKTTNLKTIKGLVENLDHTAVGEGVL